MNKNSQPLVSVIIPFYNGVAWLEEAVDSVLSQSYTNYEIIVVNDGSKENMDGFLEKYGHHVVYLLQKNSGAGAARNYGIKNAHGEFIAFLDSDDVWKKNKLEEQIAYMQKNPQLMWSHSSYETFGLGEDETINTSAFKGMLFPDCLNSCRIATPCVVIRKEVFEKNVRMHFCESMRYGQDVYLWVLLAEKYKIGHIDKTLCKVRMRGGNAAKRAYVMLRAKSELWENLFECNVINRKKVSLSIKFAYKLCQIGYSIVRKLSKVTRNQSIIEIISKSLYVLPYSILRIKRKKWK